MNKIEQFIAVYAPEDDVLFRKRLEQVIQEIKTKSQPTNEVIGMRDYFAGKVMEGICAGDWKFDLKDGTVTWVEIATKRAYEIADAMIEARE